MHVICNNHSNIEAREAADYINKLAGDAGYGPESFDWFLAQIMSCAEGIREDLDIDSTDDKYIEAGYANREEYLECLAEDMDMDYEHVKQTADLLGPDEDFDMLVVALNTAGGVQ